jgi:hypothetical protein
MFEFVISHFILIHFFISTFKKSLTVIDINTFVQVDKLNILIVEAINESAYGFDLVLSGRLEDA